MMTFWPMCEGDNHCPKCGSELYVWSAYVNDSGHSFMYQLRCCECGEGYLLHETTRSSMNVRLRVLRTGQN